MQYAFYQNYLLIRHFQMLVPPFTFNKLYPNLI